MAHDSDPDDIMFFEDFKMILKAPLYRRGPGAPPEDRYMVQPKIGLKQPQSVELLMQRIFEQIKDQALAHGKKHSSTPIREVTWVLTVPVIWSDDARDLMKKAAEKAGLTNVLMLSEPWAAALCAMRNDPPAVGERVLVVDLGAGTADFTFYEIGQKYQTCVLANIKSP